MINIQENKITTNSMKSRIHFGGENIILVDKDQLNVRAYGNTSFAGWTIPVPLLPIKYVLPPSCILFEAYVEVRSGMFNIFFPSKRRQDILYNNLEAFVTCFILHLNM